MRAEAAARNRRLSREGREIGPLPAIVDPARRRRALRSLQVYCEEYKPAVFNLAWSADQLEAIAIAQRCIKSGGLFALAMPRGGGKTAIAIAAVEWAILNGYRRFVVLVGATDGLAGGLINAIKDTFERNDLLAEDFPEVCYPIRKLEFAAQRSRGQLLNGNSCR